MGRARARPMRSGSALSAAASDLCAMSSSGARHPKTAQAAVVTSARHVNGWLCSAAFSDGVFARKLVVGKLLVVDDKCLFGFTMMLQLIIFSLPLRDCQIKI